MKVNLIKNGIASIFIKLSGTGCSLITAIILARNLGPEQYGYYSYILAIVSILAIPAMFGLPNLLVRETAKSEANKDWGLISGLWSWANSLTFKLLIFILIIFMGYVFFNKNNISMSDYTTLLWGALLIPLSAFAALRSASLRGLRKVTQGQLPEQVVKPLIFLLFLVIPIFLINTEVNASFVMMLNALSTGLAFIFGAWLLVKAKPPQLSGVQKKYEIRSWFNSVMPLAMISGLDILVVETATIMLGSFRSVAEVGIYKIAVQGAMLVIVGVTAMNTIIAPHISKYSAESNIESTFHIARKSARFSSIIALIGFCFFLFFGKKLIVLIFGQAYEAAYLPLLWLSAGQLVHAIIGPGGIILTMSGYEKATLYTLLLAAICNICLNALLIPHYGINGAAIATFLSIFLRKIVVWYMVYTRFKMSSAIF
ncbi:MULTISPECIES: flippase [unclassified Acinetobacter]|uniref:flippase n=1 Tax=unclassified Acinetobacter TaxID=196816 RepID=UPI0015D4391D|nr:MULTISPECIES: flippase [unclassified Acinetobacter]